MNFLAKYFVGDVLINKQNEQFMIVDTKSGKFKIKFLDDYGYETEVNTSSITQRAVKNPYRITVQNKGFEGNIVDLHVIRKERNIWFRLLRSKYDYPERWNCLEYFIQDIRKIQYYNDFLSSNDLTIFFNILNNKVVGFFVDYENRYGKQMRIEDLYSNKFQCFNSLKEAKEKLGWGEDTIRQYCNKNKIVDGYKYSWIRYGENLEDIA